MASETNRSIQTSAESQTKTPCESAKSAEFFSGADEQNQSAKAAPLATKEASAFLTGEEDEARVGQWNAALFVRPFLAHQSKDKDEGGWRGVGGPGYVRMLQHKETGRVRLVFRSHGSKKVWFNAYIASSDRWLNQLEAEFLDEASSSSSDGGGDLVYLSARACSYEAPSTGRVLGWVLPRSVERIHFEQEWTRAHAALSRLSSCAGPYDSQQKLSTDRKK